VALFDWFGTVEFYLYQINKKADYIMAQVKVNQEALDQFATDINAAADDIAEELRLLVESSANNLTDADTTALQAAVDKLKTLDTPETQPAPDPETPTTDTPNNPDPEPVTEF
jgi:hypothetical protein